MANINDFLSKINYEIVVHFLSNGLIIYYPSQKLYNIAAFEETYIYTPTGFAVSTPLENYTISIEPWAVRTGIVCSIINRCNKIKYKPSLVQYYIGFEKAKVTDIPCTDEQRESILLGLIQDDMVNGYYSNETNARKLKMYKSYLTVLNILENT